MNRQLIFTTAFMGLQAQGFLRAYDEEPGCCRYRASNGRKCAIGQCIPDELYDPEMDRAGFSPEEVLDHRVELSTLYGVTDLWLGPADEDFLTRLQAAHDGADDTDPRIMEDRLREVAHRFSLEVPS